MYLPIPSRPVAVSEPNPCPCRCRTTRRLPYLSSVLGLSSRSLPSPHQPNGSWLHELPSSSGSRLDFTIDRDSCYRYTYHFQHLACSLSAHFVFLHDQRTVTLCQDSKSIYLQPSKDAITIITTINYSSSPSRKLQQQPSLLLSFTTLVAVSFLRFDSKTHAIPITAIHPHELGTAAETRSLVARPPNNDFISDLSNSSMHLGNNWLCGNQASIPSTAFGKSSR